MVESAKQKKNAQPPPRLIFAWWCEKYRQLPGRGALIDQDYREMYLNEALPRIYAAVSNWRNGGGANMTPDDRSVINWLVKIGVM